MYVLICYVYSLADKLRSKSQIAIECSYQIREQDPQTWVFWVHASNAVRFEQAYRSIAATLQLPGWDDFKVDILRLVSGWLSNVDNGCWLMILDNADDIDVFRQTQEETSQSNETPQHRIPLAGYIPQTSTGSVLITTRDRKAALWLSGGYENVIPVEAMDEDQAKQLLRTRIPPSLSTELDLEHLVRELEYLPLAITQAAAYISARATRMTVSKYLTLFRQGESNQRRLLDEDSGDLRRDQGLPNSVIRTWQISFDQIEKTSPRSAELLSLIAMFDRQGIPESLLLATNQHPLDLEDALSPLHEFSLITIEKGGKSFEMHRLVQLASRKWLEQRIDIHKWQEKAINVLSKAFPSGDHSNWGTCESLLPHAQEVLKHEPASNNHLLARGSILYNMAWYSWRQGRYTNAREQIQESLEIRERLLGNFHLSILDSVELLGLVLRAQGKYTESEAMNRRALAGKETALGPEHPDTLMSVNNLADVLQAQGKYAESEAMNRRALAGSETALGPEHPDTLTSVSNLALVLRAQGKYAEAEAMNRQALAGRETALGPEHPDTLTSLYCLAHLLHSQMKYAEASVLYKRAYNGYQEVLGPDHPTTLACSEHYSSNG
jgi:tetratricopeptide (TPR) repeat protein